MRLKFVNNYFTTKLEDGSENMRNSIILESAQRDRSPESDVILNEEGLFVWKAFLPVILEQYALPRDGIHGIAHWARVFENGLRLAEGTGALLSVVQLFALFHDAKRTHDGWEPGHGRRGAEYAYELREIGLLPVSNTEFDLLYAACEAHTDGFTDADMTIQTCWDADRLDLNRVAILPDPKRLCTDAARSPEMLAWANTRAAQNIMPAWVKESMH
jgi:uncharacterized protein